MNWKALVEAVQGKLSHAHMITTVWHPSPEAELIHADCGNVRVLIGEAQYQLSTGEIVKL